jgi:hypothetical protein
MMARQRLSVRGDPSPNKRAGANLNPRLTLSLAVPKSLIALKEGAARPVLHPRGEGNAQRATALKLWGPRRRGKGRGRGQDRSASKRWPSSRADLDSCQYTRPWHAGLTDTEGRGPAGPLPPASLIPCKPQTLPKPQTSPHPAAQDSGVASPSSPPPLRGDAGPVPSTVEPPKEWEEQAAALPASNRPPECLATIWEIGERSCLEAWGRAQGTPGERRGEV